MVRFGADEEGDKTLICMWRSIPPPLPYLNYAVEFPIVSKDMILRRKFSQPKQEHKNEIK
jgi:hypothetical protein